MRTAPGQNSFLFYHVIVLGAALGITTSLAVEPGGEWPQFHGPNRDNISTETGLLSCWPDGGPELDWTFSGCGRGYAGVSAANGMVFTSGDFEDQERVLALGLDGRLIWEAQNGSSWRGSTPGSRATPTYADGLLYHLNPTGRLAAFEAKTGKEVWSVNLEEEYGSRYGTWALSENVLVEGNNVICVPGGEKGRIVALDKMTGKPAWANTSIRDGVAYGSPIAVTHDGVRQLIALLERSVVGVEVRTGKLLWSHKHPNRYNQNVTRPLYHDGHVFVTSGHRAGGRLIKIDPESGEAREVWYSEEFDNCHGGVMRLDGHLYGSGCRLYHKGLLCVDFRTGKTVYRAEPIGKVSITYADGRFYCIDQKKRVMLVKADPKEAEIVSEFELPSKGGSQSLAHPVVCGGRLYLRHANNLFAYDVREAAKGQN